MEDLINNDIIDISKNKLIHKQYDALEKLNLGFVPINNCNLQILSIITHCVENLHIFTKNQFNNINLILNKL